MRVLLVDPDTRGRAGDIVAVLARRGHAVQLAATAAEATALVDRDPCDLCLLVDDARAQGAEDMPALCRAVRARCPEASIVALLDEPWSDRAGEVIDAGLDDYSPLPFDARRLDARLRVVERNLEQRARRREAEEARAREHELVEAVLDVSRSLIIVLDTEGRVLRFNRACEDFTGIPAAEMIGTKRWVELLDEAERGGVLRLFDGMLRGTFPTEYENTWRAKDGAPRRVAWTNTAITGPDGAVRYVIGTGIDVSVSARLQARLMLADRMASVGTLAAGVAHEINNPLTYVIASLEYASRLVEQPPSGDINAAAEARARLRYSLSQAREGADRVRQIVKNLRTFSRGDEDRRGPVIVEDVIESSIDMAWNEIRHRARLVREFHPVPAVEANEARLGQVFLNLLINAAQAIPEGRVDDNRVRVVTRAEGDRVVVEISDTGRGIAPEHLPRIFDPFFTTKPVGEGTGLGLSICHGIVTALGGEISVESTPDRGSTFRVLLPPSRSLRPERSPSAPPAPPGRRARLLLVDDEANLRASLRQILVSDHDVVDVGSGAEVLDRLRKGERYDVILCDLMMPEMSGIDLFEAIATHDEPLSRRVIFLTGGAFTPRAQEFMARVPNLRLEKPFDIDDLLRYIRKVMP